MKYNLALDSGGTKVLAILYDEDFNPIKTCRVGSVRENTSTKEQIENNINELIDRLSLHSLELGQISGSMDDYLWRKASADCTVDTVKEYGEMQLGLASAGIFGYGYLALSGTGVGLMCRCEKGRFGTGGLGAAVSDEGSGYWIGREAAGAAIRDDELRGERTMLTDLIAAKYGGTRETFRNALFDIYRQNTISPSTHVASLAPLVSQAAYEGDEVAIDILKRAGKVLAERMISVIKKNDLPKNLPMTICGSAWKGHPIIFETFSSIMRDFGMEQEVILPEFEPIAGSIICHYHEKHGKFDESDKLRFKSLYKDYLYNIGK